MSIDKLLQEKQGSNKLTSNIDSILQEKLDNNNLPFSSRGGAVSPIKLDSQYDISLGADHSYEDILENRAQSQSTLDRWGNALPRLASKTLTEIAKIPGYVGGLAGFTASGDYTAKNFANWIDNSYVNYWSSLDENTTKKMFPIYTPKAVKEGNLMDHLLSASFYTDEGVDGLGFLLSAIASSGAVKALGVGAKVAKGLDMGVKAAKNIDLASMTAINTIYEAASEAHGMMEPLKRQFAEKIQKGEITQEQADWAIGEAMRDNFLANTALLIGPNLLMNKNIFGDFNTTKSALSQVTDAAGNILKTPTKLTTKELVKERLGSVGKGLMSEGFFEEGLQFSTEKYYEKRALGETDQGHLEGIISEYLDGLGTSEMQKSIFLGGLFGALGGLTGSIRENKQKNKQLAGLRNLLENNLSSYTDRLTDMYKKNEKGEFVLDANGKPEYDEVKLKSTIENIIKRDNQSALKDAYALEGNEEMFNFIRNDEFTGFALPYLMNDGLELLNKTIDNNIDALFNETQQVGEGLKTKAQLAQELKTKARKLNEIYDKADLYGAQHTDIKAPKDKQTQLANFANGIKLAMIAEYSRQDYYKERIQALSAKSAQLSLSTNELDKQLLENNNKLLDQYKEELKKSEKIYKDLFDTKKQQKLFDESIVPPKTKETKAQEEKDSVKDSTTKKEEAVQNEPTIGEVLGEEKKEKKDNEANLDFEYRERIKQKVNDLSKELEKLNKQLSQKNNKNRTFLKKQIKDVKSKLASLNPILDTINRASQEQKEFINQEKKSLNISENTYQTLGEFINSRERQFFKSLKIRDVEELYSLLEEAKDNLNLSNKAFARARYENLKAGIQYLTREDFEELTAIVNRNENRIKLLEEEIVKRELENSEKTVIELSQFSYSTNYAIKELELEEDLKNAFVEISENGLQFSIRGKEYFNLYSDPLNAINRDSDENIISVTLNDYKGNPKTFKDEQIVDQVSFAILSTEVLKAEESNVVKEKVVEEIIEKTKEEKEKTLFVLNKDLQEIIETINYIIKQIQREKAQYKRAGFTKEEIKFYFDNSSLNEQLEELLDIKKTIIDLINKEKGIFKLNRNEITRTSQETTIESSETTSEENNEGENTNIGETSKEVVSLETQNEILKETEEQIEEPTLTPQQGDMFGFNQGSTVIQTTEEPQTIGDLNEVVEKAKSEGKQIDEKKLEQKKEAIQAKESLQRTDRGSEIFEKVFMNSQRTSDKEYVEQRQQVLQTSSPEITVIISKNLNGGEIIQWSNPHLNLKRAQFNTEVLINGISIGSIPSYDQYVLKDGTPVDPNALTQEQFELYFKEHRDASIESFRKGYARAKAFNEYMLSKTKTRDSFTLSPEDTQELFNHVITPGNIGIDVRDLSTMTGLYKIDGKTLILKRNYEKGILVNITSLDNNIHNEDSEVLPEYAQMLEAIEGISNEFMNQYLAVKEDPFGAIKIGDKSYTAIGLLPRSYNEQEAQEFIDKITTKREELKENKAEGPQEINALEDYNDALNNTLFISNNRNTEIRFLVNTSGNYTIQYAVKLPSGERVRGKFYINDTVESLEEIAQKFNEQLMKSKITLIRQIGERDFRISLSGTSEEAVPNLKSIVPDILRVNKTLKLQFKDTTGVPVTPVEVVSQQEFKTEEPVVVKSEPKEEPSIEERKKDIGKGLDEYLDEEGIAYKKSNIPAENLIDLEEARENLKRLFGDRIPVKDIELLVQRLDETGYTFGAVKDSCIFLSKAAEKGTEYHEAFHIAFRAFTSDQTIQALLDIEEQNTSKTALEAYIQRLKKIPQYRNLNDKNLKELALEERIADKFQEYLKGKQPKGFLRNIFEKIKNFIKNLFSSDETEKYFYKLERGGFRNSPFLHNRYSNNLHSDIAFKKLPIEIRDGVLRNISEERSQQIVNTIASLVHQEYVQLEHTNLDFNTTINSILDKEAKVYDPDNYPKLSETQKQRLMDNYSVFHKDNTAARKIIKDQVLKKLESFNIKEDYDNEDESGITKDRNYDLNQEQVGGFGSLSAEVRKDISLTTYVDTDIFGIPVTVAVNSKQVYDGISKALQNTPNEADLMRKFIKFSTTSKQSKAYVEKVVLALQLSVSKKGKISYNKDKENYYQQIVKAFNLYSVDHLFMELDLKKQAFQVSSANKLNIDDMQFNKWKQNFFNYNYDAKKINKALNKLEIDLANKSETLTAATLNKKIKTFDEAFKMLGMHLSKGYIEYIIVQSKEDEHLTEEQIEYKNLYKHTVNNSSEFILSTIKAVNKIVTSGSNPFEKDMLPVYDEETGVQIGTKENNDSGAVGSLKRIAKDNSIFDETIGVTNFINAEGKSIYGLQQGTYNLTNAIILRSVTKDTKFDSSYDLHKKDNFLLNNPDFQRIQSQLIMQRADGLRQGSLKFIQDEEVFKNLEKQKKEGVAFGSFSTRELLLYAYGLWTKRSKLYTADDNSSLVSPVIINIMEAANSLDLINLPIHDVYNEKGLTDLFLDTMTNEVQKEFNRIKEVQKFNPDPELNRSIYKEAVQGFNTGDKQRGLQFWNFKDILPKRLQVSLTTTDNFDKYKEEVKEALKEYFENTELEQHLQLLSDEGIVNYNSKNKTLSNVLLDRRFTGSYNKKSGLTDLHMSNDLRQNIAQMYFSNYLNTFAYQQLNQADPSITLKDSLDWFKRAKGLNGSGSTLYSENFPISTFKTLADYKDGKLVNPGNETEFVYAYKGRLLNENESADKAIKDAGVDVEKIPVDSSDAQVWGNIKWFRNTFRALGRLPQKFEYLFDKIENNEDLTSDEIKTLKKNNLMLNSLKVVYFDGTHYIKCSVTLLSPAEVKYRDSDGNLQTLPSGDTVKSSMYSELYEKGIDLLIPPSASKMFTKAGIGTLDNKHFKLQQENPSNKILIKDPTQMQHNIGAEQDLSTKIEGFGELNTVQKALDFFKDNMAQRTKISMIPYLNYIYKVHNGEYTEDLAAFQKQALKSLTMSGASEQMLDFFKVNEGTNKPEYSLNLSTALNEFTKLYNAHFSKALSHVIPGYKVTLESDYGHYIYEDSKGNIVTTAEFKANPVKHKGVTARKLQYNKPYYDKQGNFKGYYTEVVLPYHFMEQFDLKVGEQIPEEIALMFGVRIPTQDKHSALALRIVDSTPVYKGSNAIFPKEIVFLTGSDFDIDSFYIHRPDHYVKDGVFRLFGNPIDSKYEQYLRWWSTQPLVKNLVKENLQKDLYFNSAKEAAKDFKKYKMVFDPEFDSSLDIFDVFKTAKSFALEQALQQVGLPGTEQEFNTYNKGELNLGTINNNILTAKIALQTNDGIRDITKVQTTLERIEEVGDQLAKLLGFNELSDLDVKYPVQGLNAMVQAFSSNKAGQKSIGAAVNSTAIFSLLNTYKVKLSEKAKIVPVIDNKTYDNFSNTLTTDGTRIFELLDNLTSAMTDNPKHQFVSKLNMSINGLSFTSYLTALGVPLQDSVFIINTEFVKDYLHRTSKKNVQTAEEQGGRDVIYDKLISIIKSKLHDLKYEGELPADFELNTKDIKNNIKNLKGEKTAEYYLTEYKILNFFKKIEQDSQAFFAISDYLKLVKGIDADFETGDKIEDSFEKLIDDDFPFDLNGALQDKFYNQNKITFEEYRKASKSSFINRTDYYQRIKNIVIKNLSTKLKNKKEVYKQLNKNLLGFLSTQAFYKRLLDRGIDLGNKNKFLFPKIAQDLDYKDIYQQYLDIPNSIKDENKFLKIVNIAPNFEKGIIEVNFNTRIKDNKLLEDLVISGFDDLMRNPSTEAFAKDLFHYLAAKDALLYKNKSIISVLPAYMFKSTSNSLKTLLDLLKHGYNKDLEPKYQEIFGKSQKTLFEEFMELYMRDVQNNGNLVKIKQLTIVPAVQLVENNIQIDTSLGYIKKESTYTITGEETEEELDDIANADEKNALNRKRNTAALEGMFSYKTVQNKKGKDVRHYIFPYILNVNNNLYKLTEVNGELPVIGEDNTYSGKKAVYVPIQSIETHYGLSLQENTDNSRPETRKINKKAYTRVEQNFSEYLQAVNAFPTQVPDNVKAEISKKQEKITSTEIDFQEEQTTGYRNRTIKNASADATIAIAVDFNSAGEKLTKSSVLQQNKKYIPIDANSLEVTKERVNKIVETLNSVNAKTLNIAGNGIYTMKGKYTQQQLDDFTYDLLNQVVNSPNLKTKIESIRSGGQTGFDEAGAKAAQRLGIPTIILAPKGWVFRNIEGKDISNEGQFKARFKVSKSKTTSNERAQLEAFGFTFETAESTPTNKALQVEQKDEVQELWDEYKSRILTKNPEANIEDIKQAANTKGIQWLRDYLKKCY